MNKVLALVDGTRTFVNAVFFRTNTTGKEDHPQ